MHSANDPRPSGHPEFAATYAAFSSALRIEDVPPAALDAARANLLDTLACAFAGYSAPGVQEVIGLAQDWGGAPQSAIWGAGTRVPAHHAAWVNGMMAHARDYDDTHDAAILHAGVAVVPAAIAAAELRADATGADLLAGVVAGLELTCRLGMATTIGIIESGFIYTSLFGYFGATVAAARVLGLDAAQTVNAIGIAFSQAAGTHQVTRDAALTKRMQPGLAAKAALMSVQLAQRGIRGAQNTFDGADGLFRIYLRNGYDPVALREGLGKRFEMTGLSYKPYPCCRFNHTAIDAALAIAREPGFDPAKVDHIRVGINRQAFEAVCTPPRSAGTRRPSCRRSFPSPSPWPPRCWTGGYPCATSPTTGCAGPTSSPWRRRSNAPSTRISSGTGRATSPPPRCRCWQAMPRLPDGSTIPVGIRWHR